MNTREYSKKNALMFFELCMLLTKTIKELEDVPLNVEVKIDDESFYLVRGVCKNDICLFETNEEDSIYPYIAVTDLDTVENLIIVLTAIKKMCICNIDIESIKENYTLLRNEILNELDNYSLDELLYFIIAL